MTDSQERVRLRAREGEAVEWTRRVAQRAGTLKDMMDDAPTEDGVYPVPMIAAAELAVLREMCEADSMPARLEQCLISELFRLVEGASFLDAPGALNHAQCALATRLNGKRADELRELLGATDDFGSAENRVAALAEPAFSPGGQLSVATAGSAADPPALQPQPSLSGIAVTDDAKEVALGMVDVGTLAELKGVSQSWLALARRVLCSRLSRCEGQSVPTQMAEITDLNIKVLVDAGRPWEAAAAGRMLPSLARLRWEGFTVSVAAVREVDLDEDEDEDETPFLGGRAKAALLSCIEGNGELPLKLLLAAVACAGSGEVHGIPVQMMRDDSVSELVLHGQNIGVPGGMLIAYLVPVMGGLTKISLAFNELGEEGTKAICEALKQNKQNKILKELDLSGFMKTNIGGAAGAMHVADMLGVNGGLTKVSLALNELGEEGTKAICEALEQNKTLKELEISGNMTGNSNIGGTAGVKHVAKMLGVNGGLTSINLSGNQLCGIWTDWRGDQHGTYTTEGIIAIANAIRVNGALTKLSLAQNGLEEEGTKAICEALEQNTTLMELDLSGGYPSFNNIGGAAGAKHVAKMLGVNGALTVTNLLGNQLDAESAKMLAKVAKQKGISLCGIQRDQTTADFSHKNLKPPDAILLASDLSQTVVTGGLTSLDLSSNQLCGSVYGTYTAEGITVVADALRVNGELTALNLSFNYLKDEGINAVCEAIQSNKETKLALLNFEYNGIGPGGANAVAAMVAVTDGLTALDLSSNDLKDEGVRAVCKAIQSNKETKLASLNFKNNGIGPGGANAVATMVAVTGALMTIE